MKNTFSIELAKIIRNVIELDNDSCKIYEQYSGRGMYGRNCFGITIGEGSDAQPINIVLQVLNELKAGTYPNAEDMIQEMMEADWKQSRDSLGLDTIFYFPNIQWPMEEAEGDEAEEEEQDEDDQ